MDSSSFLGQCNLTPDDCTKSHEVDNIQKTEIKSQLKPSFSTRYCRPNNNTLVIGYFRFFVFFEHACMIIVLYFFTSALGPKDVRPGLNLGIDSCSSSLFLKLNDELAVGTFNFTC